MGPRPTVIDMSPYINSCSPWYRMLRNTEYFKKGKIVYIDKDRPETQCIIWPHGQYIRLDETKMNQHPYINQFPEIGHQAMKTGLTGKRQNNSKKVLFRGPFNLMFHYFQKSNNLAVSMYL